MAVHWLEVPVTPPSAGRASTAIKYDVGNAVVVHGDNRAYVGLADRRAVRRLLARPDVRKLSDVDLATVQPVPGLPVSWSDLAAQVPGLGRPHARFRVLGLGDAIAVLTRRARIPECGACARRRKALNRITVWGWWRRRPTQVQPSGS
ncbi:hypothetical protein [Goodfellowiella coeruleoviolacea]|uniref:Uncharacterized protein n=1 Tax=Goodfellowiella coeruleoviolacea TaxID=334858 RepID=A0AAE3G933_9PSEU|nr:hypothetical protein [Goodfellowiella coeruleoviolacea]MCP2163922.1 hypothetical protein [Goodfellowiella coeruleoviolacea]